MPSSASTGEDARVGGALAGGPADSSKKSETVGNARDLLVLSHLKMSSWAAMASRWVASLLGAAARTHFEAIVGIPDDTSQISNVL